MLATIEPVRSAAPRSEQIAQVRSLLARLPEPLAEVAVYYHVDGMTHEEIAAMIGCSRRQVGNLVERLQTLVAQDDDARTGPAWPEEQQS